MGMAARAASAPAVCRIPGVCRAARRQHPAARVLFLTWWSGSDDGCDSPHGDILNHSFGLPQRRPASESWQSVRHMCTGCHCFCSHLLGAQGDTVAAWRCRNSYQGDRGGTQDGSSSSLLVDLLHSRAHGSQAHSGSLQPSRHGFFATAHWSVVRICLVASVSVVTEVDSSSGRFICSVALSSAFAGSTANCSLHECVW